MNLKEALKAAIDGAKITRPCYKETGFCLRALDTGEFADSAGYSYRFDEEQQKATDWEIVPEPVKYSVDVWFDKPPKHNPEKFTFDEFVFGCFGKDIEWSSKKFNDNDKKYRITVEEVSPK